MGLRSSVCQFGKRLLAALVNPQNIYKHGHNSYNDYPHTPTPAHPPPPSTHPLSRSHVEVCRVCAVQQASRMSENLVCNSHRINQQLTSRPLPPLPTNRPLPALPSITSSPKTPTLYTTHRRQDSGQLQDSVSSIYGGYSTLLSPSSYASSSTLSLAMTASAQGEMLAHNVSYARFVHTLQTSLQNVRYAISGPLAIRLHAPLWYIDIGEPLDGSIPALQPSIVCPQATRDVLPSWAAVSQNAFRFDRRRPYRLQLQIDGQFVTVRIEWVEDHEFDSGEDSFYQIDRTEGAFCVSPEGRTEGSTEDSICGSPYDKLNTLNMAPPVLTLQSLLQHTAQAYTHSGISDTDSMEHKVLGHQVDACLRFLDCPTMHGSQFLMPPEVPAVYDPAFSSMYFAAFGAEGVQRLHAVCAGIPSFCAPQVETVSRPASSKKTITRKPIPLSSQPKSTPDA